MNEKRAREEIEKMLRDNAPTKMPEYFFQKPENGSGSDKPFSLEELKSKGEGREQS